MRTLPALPLVCLFLAASSSCTATTSPELTTLGSALGMARPRADGSAGRGLPDGLDTGLESSAPLAFESPEPDHFLGLELQAYPAGVIAGLHLERRLGERDVLTFRAAWNATDRGDFGEHDDESGGGFGAGVGYRRWLEPGHEGWMWGGRIDLWDLEVDWEDDPPLAAKGTTDVLVLQPTLEGGYSWHLGNSPWRLDLTASFGFEINVDSDGEDVGEGAIGLLGATLVRGL